MSPFRAMAEILKSCVHLAEHLRHSRVHTAEGSDDAEDKNSMLSANDQLPEQHELPMSVGFYVLYKKIGVGSFGSVYTCKHKQTKKRYAGKLFSVSLTKDPDHMNMIYSEVDILKKLSHKNTISFVDLVFSRRGILLVMELVQGTELYDIVPKDNGIIECFARIVFLQLVEAIEYLHSQRIVHRDIKVENVMVDGKGNVKLVDYGLAESVPKERAEKHGLIISGVCGTKFSYSPEIVVCDKNDDYSCKFAGDKVDIWAAGVLLYEMVSGNRPFDAVSRKDLYEDITSLSIDFDSLEISPELEDLLRSIFKFEPTERPSIEEILNHPWSKGTSFDDPRNVIITSSSGNVHVSFVDRATKRATSCPKSFLQLEKFVGTPRPSLSYPKFSGSRSEVNIVSNSCKGKYGFSSLSELCQSTGNETTVRPSGRKHGSSRRSRILRRGRSAAKAALELFRLFLSSRTLSHMSIGHHSRGT